VGYGEGLERKHEELLNSLTHGLGLALCLAGVPPLIALAALRGGARLVVAVSIYGACLLALYTASTLYHALRGARVKRFFKLLDHSAIYLLIAGTYTPFTLVVLRGAWGWTLLGLVWGIAAIGILWKVFFLERLEAVSVALYVAMGWLAVAAIKPMFAALHTDGLLWILAGGLAYTGGLVFFAWKRVPYNHAIWHLFVMAGSLCHYLAVVRYVLPGKA
jgi:hemolysin III